MISSQFIRAGRAVFTVENNKGDHYTFKVKAPKSPQQTMINPPLYVWVKTGSQQYTYMGMLVDGHCVLTYKSKFTPNATCFKVFNWAVKHVDSNVKLPSGYDIHHEGKCGKCGRALTDPDSIKSGFGPTCINFVK